MEDKKWECPECTAMKTERRRLAGERARQKRASQSKLARHARSSHLRICCQQPVPALQCTSMKLELWQLSGKRARQKRASQRQCLPGMSTATCIIASATAFTAREELLSIPCACTEVKVGVLKAILHGTHPTAPLCSNGHFYRPCKLALECTTFSKFGPGAVELLKACLTKQTCHALHFGCTHASFDCLSIISACFGLVCAPRDVAELESELARSAPHTVNLPGMHVATCSNVASAASTFLVRGTFHEAPLLRD